MQVLAKPEFKSLGYIWGPKQATFETSNEKEEFHLFKNSMTN